MPAWTWLLLGGALATGIWLAGFLQGRRSWTEEQRQLDADFEYVRRLRCDLLLWEARLRRQEEDREAVDQLLEGLG